MKFDRALIQCSLFLLLVLISLSSTQKKGDDFDPDKLYAGMSGADRFKFEVEMMEKMEKERKKDEETPTAAPAKKTESAAADNKTASAAPNNETASVAPVNKTASVAPDNKTVSVAPVNKTESAAADNKTASAAPDNKTETAAPKTS